MKIVFFGDSITEGWFEENSPIDYEEVYHRKLAQLWNRTDIEIINAGVGGDSAEKGYARIERDVISHQPDMAVVCFGLNDASRGEGHLTEYLAVMEAIFRRLEGIQTIFMTPNMFNTYVHPDTAESLKDYARITAEAQNSGIMERYMQGAAACAEKNRVPVCDCYREWKKLRRYGIDTDLLLANHINHPTRKMHWLFADKLYETISL